MLGEFIHRGQQSRLYPDFTITQIGWDEIPEEFSHYEAVIFAKRFNIGNLNNEAYVRFLLPAYWNSLNSGDLVIYINKFFTAVSDVTSTDSGDCVIIPELIERTYKDEEICESRILYDREPAAPMQPVQPAEEPRKRWTHLKLRKAKKQAEDTGAAPQGQIDIITETEQREFSTIELEQKRVLSELEQAVLNYVLTYHTDPTPLINQLIQGKLIINKDELSKLVINENTDIVLADYDETVVKMPALHRTIYMLFLKHMEDGIVLKCFGDLKREIMDVYSIVMPNRDEELAQVTIKNLCDPMSNTLSEYISKINKRFRSIIKDRDIAEHYCIKGRRGEPYRIGLPPHLVQLPEWLN
ncbi:MAG: hypothetical protein J5523_09865 [Muribaculaceae bacterium]|nr:hypothetical protein [Muribaculaceae bacterium]